MWWRVAVVVAVLAVAVAAVAAVAVAVAVGTVAGTVVAVAARTCPCLVMWPSSVCSFSCRSAVGLTNVGNADWL